VTSHIVDPSSIEVSRRGRRAKTDRIDLEKLMRAFLAYLRGEPRVCSMLHVPSPEDEDRKRSSRERERLLKEQTAHTNRIKALLFGQGIRDVMPLKPGFIASLEAVRTGYGRLDGVPVGVGVMDFNFMGGSMGSVVGEKLARVARRSAERRTPLIIVSASGGARMQEGVLSLMQMAKTSVEIARLRTMRVPFISILTNPTTGGVSASYAMQGDVILAEPGAVIGFAGPRVIKQTIGQDLPEGFQTAEFLLEHGMVDAVVPRSELRDTTGQLLRHMAGRRPAEAAD